jgi:hypothetical protein
MKEEITLRKVGEDLFDEWESPLIESDERRELISTYFVNLTNRLNEDDLPGNNSNFDHLEELAKKRLLPAYDIYESAKKSILKNKEERSLQKYVIGTIIVANVIGAAFTMGQSLLRPPFYVFSALIGGSFGTAIKCYMDGRDDDKIKSKRKEYLGAVESLEASLTDFELITGGDLSSEDVMSVCQLYKSTDDFWRDYYTALDADPTDQPSLEKLNIPNLSPFLGVHIEGDYSAEIRENRFKSLYSAAHEFFVDRGGINYIRKQTGK